MEWNKNAMQLHFNRKLLLFSFICMFFSNFEAMNDISEIAEMKRDPNSFVLGRVIKHLFAP